MCLAIPARVVELTGPDTARIDLVACARRSRSRWSTAVAVGDYVIVHVGYALTRLDARRRSARSRRSPRPHRRRGGGQRVTTGAGTGDGTR